MAGNALSGKFHQLRLGRRGVIFSSSDAKAGFLFGSPRANSILLVPGSPTPLLTTLDKLQSLDLASNRFNGEWRHTWEHNRSQNHCSTLWAESLASLDFSPSARLKSLNLGDNQFRGKTYSLRSIYAVTIGLGWWGSGATSVPSPLSYLTYLNLSSNPLGGELLELTAVCLAGSVQRHIV